tara:strand:+ start:74 stop:1402 length:1329 start_codon:yes stop_codon:yes gene_type:complete
MIQTENSRADSDMDAVKLQIKMIDESKNILSLGGTIFSDMLKEKEIIFTEIKPKLNLGLVEYIEKLSNENSWDKELPNLDKKYDIIILNEILGQVSEPRILLQRMSAILSDNGSIIAHIKNSSYLTNTWKTLGGIFKPDDDEKNNFHSFDLGSLLSFLNDANFAVSELNRIEKKIQWVPNYAPDYNFPYSLLQVLKKDPESEVFSYVFRIEMKNPTGNKTGIWTSKIGKNYFLESLKDKIEYYESSIKPIKNQEKIIDELETSIKEMNNHIDLISASRDVVINRLEDSVKKSKNEISELKNLLDETKDKTDVISSSRDVVINRLEDSVKKSKNEFELINTAKDVVKKELDESKEKIQNAFLKYYKNKSGTKLPDNLIRKGLVEEILHGYHVPSASQEWLSTLTLAEKERLIVGLEFILADYKRLRDALIQSKVYRLTKKFTR